MNPASTSFVLGYHGCDRKVAERVLAGKQQLIPSRNDYDWLGVRTIACIKGYFRPLDEDGNPLSFG